MTIQFFIKSITLYYLPSSDYYFEVSSIGQFPALLDGIRRQYILHVYNLCRALCTHRNERLVYGWRKILENITCGYGHHEWPKATSDKSIIFTSDDHNHK